MLVFGRRPVSRGAPSPLHFDCTLSKGLTSVVAFGLIKTSNAQTSLDRRGAIGDSRTNARFVRIDSSDCYDFEAYSAQMRKWEKYSSVSLDKGYSCAREEIAVRRTVRIDLKFRVRRR